ncbi:MAG TPA: universal stress protein [Candidatus Nitrosopolaris sp.]|nr:universal stress protein [Candidatus Nitrosopolaris sp.]
MSEVKEPKLSKILVAIDGSEQSMHAADYAIDMATKYNAELIAIHVVSAKLLGFEYTPQPMLFNLPATPNTVNNITETSKREAERWLDRIKQQLLEHGPKKVKLKTEVIIAIKPLIAGEIVDYAQQENVDLIVIGTKGRSGFKRLLLGSVALGVVTYAHCPVMVTK